MSIGKRLISTGVSATPTCTTDSTDPFGDGYGVALYSLDYDASTAPDATTDYSGTPTNVEFGVDGHINWGARFNGSSSKIEVSNSVIPNGASSISFWYNPEGSTGTEYILGQGIATASKGITVYWYNQSFGALVAKGTSSLAGSAAGSTTYSTTDWHHVVFTWDGTTSSNAFKVYVNGSLLVEGTSDTSSASIGTYTNFAIGGLQGGTFASGSIDQVRIFSKALNQTEIDTLYAETACVYTATTTDNDYPTTNTAYYKLDNSAEDEKGSYDGTESNITYEFGRFGTAAVFNGSSSYISTGINFSTLPDTKSFSMWVKSTGSSSVGFGGMSGSGVNNGLFVLDESAGDLSYIPKFGGYHNGDASNIITNGWNHFVVTDTNVNGNVKMYINGDEVTVTKINSTSYIDNTDMQIGRQKRGNGTTFFQTGTIDQVRVFSSELTSSQVTELYNEKQAYITKSASDPFGDSSEVAFYKMENNSNDSTGSNNGTNNGATFTTTDALFDSYSASFDGSNDYINTNYSIPSNTSDYTLSMWIYMPSTSSYGRFLAGNNNSSANNGFYTSINTNGTGRFYLRPSSGTASQIIGSIVMAAGQWHHFVITSNSTTNTLYINGQKDGTASRTTITFSNSITLGRAGQYSSDYFPGNIDQVRIFDRALEGDEVFKLYAEVIN